MFEKEAKERAKDFTDNKERQVAYECGFLDGTDLLTKEKAKWEVKFNDSNRNWNELVTDWVKDLEREVAELKEDNADLKQSLDWANERESEDCKRIAELEQEKCELLGIIQGKDKAIKELEERIEKMKCCQNCKHHYWLYEELSCRIHKIDVDTCNSWEMKND